MTEKTELAPIERAAIALESSKTEQYLKTLATKHTGITVVKDKAGREQAHGAYIEVMRARTAVEKAAKEARDDANKFSKAVIAEAARLVAIVEPEENRLKEARDAWDAEQARINAEAEAKERARVLAITERIAAIKSYVVLANNCRTSERVAELQTKLAGVELLGFEEFADEAAMAHSYATHHLNTVLADRKAQEAEQARIKAEQEAEAARLKAEQERIKAEQKAEAEKLAYERKLMEEERAAIQAELDAKAEKQREEMAAQRAAAQAEAKRVADEARAQAEAAEAKARAAAEEMAAQRAELERLRAYMESVKEHVEQPLEDVVAQVEAKRQAAMQTEPDPALVAAGPAVNEPAPVAEAPVVTEPDPEPTRQPPAPVASAIVLAVAEFFCTDNKTAARWITERAAEIATLKG